MPSKIFWDKQNGSVYWLQGDDVIFCPMNADNTADLDGVAIAEYWEVPGDEARVRASL